MVPSWVTEITEMQSINLLRIFLAHQLSHRLIVAIDAPLGDLAFAHDGFPRRGNFPMIFAWQFAIHREGAAGRADDRHTAVFLENLFVGNAVVGEPGKIHLPSGAHLFPAYETIPKPVDEDVVFRHSTPQTIHVYRVA